MNVRQFSALIGLGLCACSAILFNQGNEVQGVAVLALSGALYFQVTRRLP